MQAYQIHSSAIAGCCELSNVWNGFTRSRDRSCDECLAVSYSPGRARRSEPYPPSYRRRRQ